jgi:hypothetical protein
MFEWNRSDLETMHGKNLLEMFLAEPSQTIPLQHCMYHKVVLQFMYDLSGPNGPIQEDVWEPFPHQFGDNVVVNLASLRMGDDDQIEICKVRSHVKPICLVPRTVLGFKQGANPVETSCSISVWNRILDIESDERRRDYLKKDCGLRQDEKGEYWARNQLRIRCGMAQLMYRY